MVTYSKEYVSELETCYRGYINSLSNCIDALELKNKTLRFENAVLQGRNPRANRANTDTVASVRIEDSLVPNEEQEQVSFAETLAVQKHEPGEQEQETNPQILDIRAKYEEKIRDMQANFDSRIADVQAKWARCEAQNDEIDSERARLGAQGAADAREYRETELGLRKLMADLGTKDYYRARRTVRDLKQNSIVPLDPPAPDLDRSGGITPPSTWVSPSLDPMWDGMTPLPPRKPNFTNQDYDTEQNPYALGTSSMYSRPVNFVAEGYQTLDATDSRGSQEEETSMSRTIRLGNIGLF